MLPDRKTIRHIKSITEDRRALDVFIDRKTAIRLFLDYLHADPPQQKVLFFHGDGGNGKSLLLQFLCRHCCYYLPESIRSGITSIDHEQVVAIKDMPNVQAIPYAHIDFAPTPGSANAHREVFAGLAKLRRSLAGDQMGRGYNLRFPLYDFACLWYLNSIGKLTTERLHDLLPPEETDFVVELYNAFAHTSWGLVGKAASLFTHRHQRLREWFTFYIRERKLDGERKDEVQEIKSMNPESELLDELPRLFAEDLRIALSYENSPQRVALFFDTHEAFWGDQRQLSDDLFFGRDKWLRQLLTSLDLSSGVVVVVAGRELPRWSEASTFYIPEEKLEPYHIGHFSNVDAQSYLHRAGIEDIQLRDALVNLAQIQSNKPAQAGETAERGEVHPFLLGLGVDVVRAAEKRGLPLTLEDLQAAAPSIAHEIDNVIGTLLRYAEEPIQDAVHALSACRSFNKEIYLMLGKELDFRVSDADFRTLTKFSFVWEVEGGEGSWYRIHELLRRLFYERGDPKTRAADEVLQTYYEEQGEIDDLAAYVEAIYHRNRLNWEVGVASWIRLFDVMREAHHYELCKALLLIRNELEIGSASCRARVLLTEGAYLMLVARYDEALQAYLGAVSAYDEAIVELPKDTQLYHDKGMALYHLGDLYSLLSRYKEALDCCTQAISAYSESLQYAADDALSHARIHNSRGTSLQLIGDIHLDLKEYAEAQSNYERAIAAHDTAITIYAPLRSIDDEANISYPIPYDIGFHNNKGMALQALGNIYVKLSVATSHDIADRTKLLALSEKAVDCYEQAITAYKSARERAPHYVTAANNIAVVLRRLAELQGRLTVVYSSRGDSQRSLALSRAALENYRESVFAHDHSIRLAPHDVRYYTNKGLTLHRLGDLYMQVGQDQDALENYTLSLAAYEEGLQITPNYITAHHGRGMLLFQAGELHAERLRKVLEGTKDLQDILAHYQGAMANYLEAISALDHALRYAPGDPIYRRDKGLVLHSMGDLELTMGHNQKACLAFQHALNEYCNALQIVPGDERIQEQRDKVLSIINVRCEADGGE
jgi:tetratricopeptide (TPR) repeat protein